jgi:hypothetical protein
MTHRLITIVLCLALLSVLAVAALSQPKRRDGERPVAIALSAPADAGGNRPAALPGVSAGARRLDAVRTVKLFCDLVDSRRLWPAAALFATPRVWPRRELRALKRLAFRSARVHFAPDPHTIVVVARVCAAGGPESPVRDGDSTVFFTLGRVGDTAGGWLITAVTTSP